MDWVWYLFSFEGRINRAKLWLAALVIICWMIFLGMLAVIVAPLLGSHGKLHIDFGVECVIRIFNPAFYRSHPLSELPLHLFEATASLLFLWVYFATSIKRLHDRDKSAWWTIPLVAMPPCYKYIVDWLPDDSYLTLIVSLAILGFGIWAFVELYCLKGSRKTNRFGADPLAPVDTRPRWDQQSEIEMVPHKAGPPPVWHVKPGYE